MTQKISILITFLLATLLVYSQKHPVEVITDKNKNNYVFKIINHSNVQQEVTLTLTVTNLKGYKAPITKLIPAKSTKKIVTLTFIKGKPHRYASQCSYIAKPTQKEISLQKKKEEEKIAKETGNISKGIVVFSKDGCSRCHYTTSYLLNNNIDFKLFNISKNQDSRKLMWSLLKKKLPKAALKSITMPVILINGEISYNMKDIKAFVSQLKNN